MSYFKKVLTKTYYIWSRILPSFYRAYSLPSGGKVYLDITESPMMLARVTGEFEPQKHRALDYFLKTGDAYIDIGANKGDFAIHASLIVGEQGRVLAFEPEPKNCKWIKKSMIKTGMQNIRLMEAAVGAEDGTLNLYIGQKSGWHSLIQSDFSRDNQTIPVDVYELDMYLDKNPLPNLRAIKIDVEGFEKEVLQGAHKTLKTHDDLIVFIDIHPDHGVVQDEIFDILHEHGFTLYREQYPFDVLVDKKDRNLEVIAVKKQEETGV